MRVVSVSRAMAESAVRTFGQTAVPVFIGAISLSPEPGVTVRDALVSALVSATAAGVAAAWRKLQPIQTDKPLVAVAGVKQ